MKSARALVPILIVVLLVCTMALTFAWFAQTMEEVKVGNAFTIGDTNYVYLTDEDLPEDANDTIVGTLLNKTKFNGELGFREDHTPYPAGDPDAAYVAEYKIGVFMQGSEDLTLAVNFEGLTVTLGEGMTTGVTTERLWSAVFYKLKDADGELLFARYEDFAPHIGEAEKDESGGWVLTEPPGGAEGYVYLANDGRPAVLKLDRAMTEQLFRISVARVVDGVAGEYGDEVLFTYPADVNPDLDKCPERELRLKIEFGYADENDEGIPFPFADEAFRGCTFGFEVTARAL